MTIVQPIFQHAEALQHARTFSEVGTVAFEAVQSLTRYRHSWLAIIEPENPDFARILQVSGAHADVIFEELPRVPIAGDPMMAELLRGEAVVVVNDARIDPRTNKEIVNRLHNRTIVNVPMRVGTQMLGSLGVGTFGDEGVLPPTPEELDSLVIFSVQLAAAFDRVHAAERHHRVEQERQALQLRLESLQRVELMGVLASGVAHDLNNLLTVIQSGIDALVMGPDAEAEAEARGAIDQAVLVCRQLLALGRPRAPRREPIDLKGRLEATLRLVLPAIPSGVVVSRHLQPHPPVVGDQVQLDQAFANLLINARDAVGERGSIEVRTDSMSFGAAHPDWARPGEFARVSVSDSGVGVPPELLERIFDPLFTTKQQGTGLGLAVVASVVQQHQGLVRCESHPGNTRFELYLPVAH
jgi:signal transduction histidine kinase